jgi:hypothetical protein
LIIANDWGNMAQPGRNAQRASSLLYRLNIISTTGMIKHIPIPIHNVYLGEQPWWMAAPQFTFCQTGLNPLEWPGVQNMRIEGTVNGLHAQPIFPSLAYFGGGDQLGAIRLPSEFGANAYTGAQ